MRKQYGWFRSGFIALLFVGWFTGDISAEVEKPRAAVVQGQVVEKGKGPLRYANIFVVDSYDGATTDAEGQYQFETTEFGAHTLKATMVGYDSREMRVNLSPGDTLVVDFVLQESFVGLNDVQVTASAYTSGDEEKGVTLRNLDVVTTPGAAADVFLAVKSFPGVMMVDEGSGLFVRGGDVTETLTILDQATLVHPYRYESPTGGLFGIIPPFLLQGTFFSTGGFSAKYGNALSGVLEMTSAGIPEARSVQLGVGLAAASLGYYDTFNEGRTGFRFTGNYSNTEPMFRVNDLMDDFTDAPKGGDGNLSLIHDYSDTGRLKWFSFANFDRFGAKAPQPHDSGAVYEAVESNQLHNLQWREIFGDWIQRTSVSVNRFGAERELGNLDLEQGDLTYKIRNDWERDIGENFRLGTGVEWERLENTIEGEAPYYDDVTDPDALTYQFNTTYPYTRIGTYLQGEMRLARHWFAGLGVRLDYHNPMEKIGLDPRLALTWQMTEERSLRFAWGLYHQGPTPEQINDVDGNPNLELQQAQHYVATFEQRFNRGIFRVEGYYKPYDSLILDDTAAGYNNLGDGEARGVDVFLKYGEFLLDRVHGWAAYSYLDSERKQARSYVGSGGEQAYEYMTGPSPFDITHNLTLVLKSRIISLLSAGLTWRYATGRPHTPVEGAHLATAPGMTNEYYVPIEGAVGSERLPEFQRLDAQLSWYQPFGRQNALVLYLAASNLTNRENVLGYEYNEDYSEPREQTTDYRRFLYFGFSLNVVF